MLLRAVLICIFSVVATLSAKEPRQVRETGGAFVGSVGCKSSSCHGGAGPKRSQYITWSQKDFHTKAYAVLLNARSERIAEGLGPRPAQDNARCTVCHSPMRSVAQNRLPPPEHRDEGVSCESCHGAAGGWLRGHTRPDWTYNTRVAAGMRDLGNIYVRASACVACHQYLDPDLSSKGHPDLFFELDSQSVNEPKHWKDDDSWTGLREWLTGQAVALREVSWALARDPRKDDASNASWDGLAWLCAMTSSAGGAWPQVTPPSATPGMSEFNRARSEADALAQRASVSNWSETAARTLLTALASSEGEFTAQKAAPQLLGQRAKRLVFALDRLVYALNKNRGWRLKVEAELNQLFLDVKKLDAFDASAFAAHLRSFREALDRKG